MHAPRADQLDPRNPTVDHGECPISNNPAVVGELVRGLLQGREYYAPDGARLETVDEIVRCLRRHRRVKDRPAVVR